MKTLLTLTPEEAAQARTAGTIEVDIDALGHTCKVYVTIAAGNPAREEIIDAINATADIQGGNWARYQGASCWMLSNSNSYCGTLRDYARRVTTALRPYGLVVAAAPAAAARAAAYEAEAPARLAAAQARAELADVRSQTLAAIDELAGLDAEECARQISDAWKDEELRAELQARFVPLAGWPAIVGDMPCVVIKVAGDMVTGKFIDCGEERFVKRHTSSVRPAYVPARANRRLWTQPR